MRKEPNSLSRAFAKFSKSARAVISLGKAAPRGRLPRCLVGRVEEVMVEKQKADALSASALIVPGLGSHFG
jgi:hypothetical protein